MAKQLTIDGGEEAPADGIQAVAPKRRRKVAKKKAKAKVKPKKKAPQKPAQAGQWQVERVVRDARKLMTLGPDGDFFEQPLAVDGAIVRVHPCADWPAHQIDEVELQLHAAGALAVKVLPPELSDYQPAAGVEQAEAKPHRQVVLEMAGDDLALRGLLDEVMTEGGL